MSEITKTYFVSVVLKAAVQGNPRVFRGLKLEIRRITEELTRLRIGGGIPEDLLMELTLIMKGMDWIKEDGE